MAGKGGGAKGGVGEEMRAWPSLIKDISIKISGLGFHSKNRKNRDVGPEATCGPSLKIFTL